MGRRRSSVKRWMAACLLSVAWWSLSFAPPVRGDIGPAGIDANDPISVPLRWCALQGSPAVTNYAGVGEADTDGVLWRRQERATDFIWAPGAHLSFRSAFTGAVANAANFPVIADPFPPADGNPPGSATDGPGVLGDVLDIGLEDPRGPVNPGDPPAASRGRELKEARASCEAAWNNLETTFGTNLEGPIALNLRRYVNVDGSSSNLAGYGTFYISPGGSQVCQNIQSGNDLPATSNSDAGAFTGVIDNSFTLASDPHERLLAHEMGHVLFLGHGNGLDDDGDGVFDQFCDGAFFSSPPDEVTSTPPLSVMTSGGSGETVTTLQAKVARGLARVTSGAVIDPPAVLITTDAISDHRQDRVGDAGSESIDLTLAGLTVNQAAKSVVVSHTVFGMLREGRPRYLFFLDADGDVSTGGEPQDLGFPSIFKGAEFVSEVVVNIREKRSPVTDPRVWRFEGTDFVLQPLRGVRAEVSRSIEAETNIPLFDVVSLAVPVSLLDDLGSTVAFEAIAQAERRLDRLPDDPSDDDLLRLEPPQYPRCGVTSAHAGERTEVEIQGLMADRSVHVILGADEVASREFLDARGGGVIEFAIPEKSEPGLRLVTVGVDGTALTADCFIRIRSPRNQLVRFIVTAPIGLWLLFVLLPLALLWWLLVRRRRP